MKVYMEKQHFGEYHGKNNGFVYTVYRTDIRADVPAKAAIVKITGFCRQVGLPYRLDTGGIRIFRNMSNKQNYCYRFEVRTSSAPEILEYDIPDEEKGKKHGTANL